MIGTLNLYLVRRFALWLVIVTLGFGTVAVLGDFLEMLRFANRFNLGADTAFNFTLHRLPLLLMDFLPFIFLFGSVFCLLRLSQAQELAVIRAAGLSVWQFLKPLLVFTFLLSILIVLAIEPIGAHLHNRYTDKQAELTSQKSGLSFSTGGIWFRETTENGSYISRAQEIDDAKRVAYSVWKSCCSIQTGHLKAASPRLRVKSAMVFSASTTPLFIAAPP